jgi:hypothetical protein
MKLNNKVVFGFLLSFSISSCGILGQDAVTVPAYISVPSYTFVTDTLTQGYNSEAFNDMWISDGGILLGAVAKPALLPIQKIGPTLIRVDAGISNTGQDNSRKAYPMVDSYVQNKNLRPEVIDTIIPVFKYLTGAGFKFIEDFDRIGRALKINTDASFYKEGDTIFAVNDQNSWRPNTNNYCGKIEIAAGHNITQLITEEFELRGANSPTFMEIDYKSNIPLNIGYYINDPQTGPDGIANSVVLTYPNDTWRKLYIDFTGEISARKAGTTFVFFIGVYNQQNVLVPSVYIDNVKLVYLK